MVKLPELFATTPATMFGPPPLGDPSMTTALGTLVPLHSTFPVNDCANAELVTLKRFVREGNALVGLERTNAYWPTKACSTPPRKRSTWAVMAPAAGFESQGRLTFVTPA